MTRRAYQNPSPKPCMSCGRTAAKMHRGRCVRCAAARLASNLPRVAGVCLRTRQWGGELFSDLQTLRDLSPVEAVQQADSLRAELLLRFTSRTINCWKLDNPYMEDVARRVLINDMLRGPKSAKRQRGVSRAVSHISPRNRKRQEAA